MKASTRCVINFVVAAAFYAASSIAPAMPKAAEDENAQVSSGADAARPKHSSTKPAPVAAKAKSAKKPAPSVKAARSVTPKTSAKKTKLAQARK